MKKLTLVAMAAVTTSAMFSFNAMAEKTLRVDLDGLVCAFCAQGVEKKMKAQPATNKVFVSLDKKVALIGLKDGQDIADATINTEITNAGYVVKGITRSDETFDAQRAKITARK